MMSPLPDPTVASKDFYNESAGAEAQSENSDVNNSINAGPPRRTVWNRPSNGVLEAGSVMGGAISWPALSESTRPVTRSSLDVSRSIGDGSTTSSQAPALSQSSHGQSSTNSQHNSGPNHHRQRSRNRNGAGGGSGGSNSSGNGPSHNNLNRPLPPVPPPFSPFVLPYQIVQPILDTSVTGARPVRGVGVSQSHTGNDHSSNRSGSRRVNYGPRSHGEGQFHNNHGGRRDQDRRDLHVIPPYMTPPMRFLPPPIPTAAGHFVPPPPPMSFFPQMGFDMNSTIMYPTTMSPESFGTIQMMPPPFPILFPPSTENPLTNMIVKQIDYYFSDENLIKDNFLRSNMDDYGWVHVSLIASFPRVEKLTKDIPTILESLKYSAVVEVQGDKLRRRNEWNKWLFSSTQLASDHGTSSEDALSMSLHEASLNSDGDTTPKEDRATFTGPPQSSPSISDFSNGSDSANA